MTTAEENALLQSVRHLHLGADGRSVVILDQTLLPNQERFLTLRTAEEFIEALTLLRVRGAPAIGAFAGYAAYCLAAELLDAPGACPGPRFQADFNAACAKLSAARPTAVNLSWALGRMRRAAEAHPEDPLSALYAECRAIQLEDIAMCRAIGEHGLALLKDGDAVLTHCNAGELAASRYGTALAPILLGAERGLHFSVYAGETRPLLQGARLTCYELVRAGVPVTLLCDNMAATVLRQGLVQACFVGCDRIAANGDAANKIGTGGLAVLAHHYGVPFYVLGPTSSIDLSLPTGESIPIEQRDPEDVRSLYYAQPMAPAGVRGFNPAFDIASHTLISGIVTEKGVCRPPYTKSLAALFGR